MNLQVTTKKEIDTTGWTLHAHLGCIVAWMDIEGFEFNEKNYEDTEEFFRDYPDLKSEFDYYCDPTIVLKIDLNSGKILNWPEGIAYDFNNIKLTDTGKYQIKDKDGNVVTWYKGYVPECLQIDDNGYDDYLQFEVDKDGYIIGWSFDQALYDNIVNANNEEADEIV